MRSGITRRWLRQPAHHRACGAAGRGNVFVQLYPQLLQQCAADYVQAVTSVTGQLKMYTGDTARALLPAAVWRCGAWWNKLPDKDKYEFMLLDSYGGVIASSSGTDAEGIVSGEDLSRRSTARTVWVWRCTAPSLVR